VQVQQIFPGELADMGDAEGFLRLVLEIQAANSAAGAGPGKIDIRNRGQDVEVLPRQQYSPTKQYSE